MRVAIDTTPLQTGHKDRGVGRYTELLIESLQRYEKKHSYHFFTRGQKVPKDIELIHYPYFDPFFVTLPLFYSKPAVITVHDLIPLVFPDHFPAGIRGALKWLVQRRSLSRANRIIVDSEASKRDVVRIAGISEDTIDVVYLAPPPAFHSIERVSSLKSTKEKYNLPESFILYVGDINWNKNIFGMLKAFQRVTRHVSRIKLVLVGKAFLEDSNEAREIASYIAYKNLSDEVVRIGGVSEEDLVAIYNLASVYIQPSFYEGFGLPVLEAMTCGVPVVTSRAASLTEIAGPAITVEPGDPDDISRGLHEALTSVPAKRSVLVAEQKAWVRRYAWRHVARETILSYEKALA